MVKSIFVSKTFWVGILEIVFGLVGYFMNWIPQDMAWTLVVTGAAAVGLRFNTSVPVSITGK